MILFLFALVMMEDFSNGLANVQPRCEVLTTPMCKSLGYNNTSLPNLFNHTTQDEAAMEMYRFTPLFKARCSPYLNQFLCSVYAPACNPSGASNTSCNNLCEESFKGCKMLMAKFGFSWPASLNCSQLQSDEQGVCTRTSSSVNQSNSAARPDDDDSNGGSGVGSGDSDQNPLHPRCERLTISLCTQLGYNSTTVPNLFNHHSQREAALMMHQMFPLVKMGCSKYLAKFLCSLYAPQCRHSGTIPPCRSLCEAARNGCLQLMSKFKFLWPEKLNCANFPNPTDAMCIGKSPAQPRCERLALPMCKGVGYNFTMLPNFFKHDSQDEAGLIVHQFYPLVKTNCSKYLLKFLCSLYAPKCRPNGFLPPCRSFCEEARDGCLNVMSKYGFPWPETLNCSQFQNSNNGKCIGKLNSTKMMPLPTTTQKYGGKLTSVQGTLSSPNYPEPYPTDIRIKWSIVLPKAYNMIKITIESLQLEQDRNCMFDYLKIQDKMLNQVGRLHCGTYRQPYVIPVRGNEVSIIFVSDKNTSKMGFSLSYDGQVSKLSMSRGLPVSLKLKRRNRLRKLDAIATAHPSARKMS